MDASQSPYLQCAIANAMKLRTFVQQACALLERGLDKQDASDLLHALATVCGEKGVEMRFNTIKAFNDPPAAQHPPPQDTLKRIQRKVNSGAKLVSVQPAPVM